MANTASKKTGRRIVRSDSPRDIVFDYHPKTFPLVVTTQANNFLSSQGGQTSDFKISDIVAAQTGIAKLQRQGIEDKIEELALQRVKGIQEKAYKEAYDLGMIEGRDDAFNSQKIELEKRLIQFDDLLKMFDELKKRLLAENERQMMELLVQVAGRIALKHIEEDEQTIVRTLELVMADVHKDEEVTVFLSPKDILVIEELRQRGGKKAEELKRIKLEANDTIRVGGCILETNYGLIDSTIEQRVDRVLAAMRDKMPKVKNKPLGTGVEPTNNPADTQGSSVSSENTENGEGDPETGEE